MTKRILACAFAFFILLSCVSCKSGNVKTGSVKDNLNIDSECFYSEESRSALSKEIVSLFERSVLLSNHNYELSNEQRAELSFHIRSEFFEKMQNIPIYQNELEKALDIYDEFLSVYDNSSGFSILPSFYTKASLVLGSDRSAKLCYSVLSSFLKFSKENKSAELLNILQNELGEKTFSDVLGVFTFASSILSELSKENTQGSSIVNDKEILLILKKQAKYYSELKIEKRQWELSARLFIGLAPEIENDNEIYSSVGSALRASGFYEVFAGSFNELIGLYAAAVNSMTEDDISQLRAGRASEGKVICRILARAETEFNAFINSLMFSAKTDASVGYAELSAIGYEQKYLAFIDNMKYSDPPELFDAIKVYSENPESISAYGDLNRSALMYVYKLSPALAFAFEHRLAEGF